MSDSADRFCVFLRYRENGKNHNIGIWSLKITSEDGFFWQKAPCMTSLNTHYIEIYFLGTFLHHFRAIFGCMTDFRSNESDQRSQTVVIAA